MVDDSKPTPDEQTKERVRNNFPISAESFNAQPKAPANNGRPSQLAGAFGWALNKLGTCFGRVPQGQTPEVDDGQSGSSEEPSETQDPRGRLAGLALAIGIGASVLTSIGSTILWDLQERQAGSIATYNWSPIDDLLSILSLIPIGMIVYSLHPAGWMFWGGLLLTVNLGKRRWLILSALGAMLFGWHWPKHCVGLLGI